MTGDTAAPRGDAKASSLSIVIPAFNEERYLAETLEHLRIAERVLTARTGARFQILVVDNASTDRTASIARDLGATVMRDPRCAGGAVDAVYRPGRVVLRVYVSLWRVVGRIGGMAQGACQFCRRDVFAALGGYDETLYMGEDVDFFWRLRAFARQRGEMTPVIRDLPVLPSARRFNTWPLWRTLALTNPLLVLLLRRRRSARAGWYDRAPR